MSSRTASQFPPILHPMHSIITRSTAAVCRNQNKIYDAYYVQFPGIFLAEWPHTHTLTLYIFASNSAHSLAVRECTHQICLVVTHTSLPSAFITRRSTLDSFRCRRSTCRRHVHSLLCACSPFARAICTLVHDKLIPQRPTTRSDTLSQCLFGVILLQPARVMC